MPLLLVMSGGALGAGARFLGRAIGTRAQRGQRVAAGAYVAASVIGSIAALVAGLAPIRTLA